MSSTFEATPVPPCSPPAGIIAAVHESMCSTIVQKKDSHGVAIRSYGLPSNEILVTDMTTSNFPYETVLDISITNILIYLEIANSANRNFLQNRTVPFTIRPPISNPDGWLVSMMVSTVAFPNPFDVPKPNNFEMHLEAVSERLFATFAFNTTSLPTENDFTTACYTLLKSVPTKYQVFNDGWNPTYVIYSPRNATTFTNECWLQVKAA